MIWPHCLWVNLIVCPLIEGTVDKTISSNDIKSKYIVYSAGNQSSNQWGSFSALPSLLHGVERHEPQAAVHQVPDKMIPQILGLSTVLREISERLSFRVPYQFIAFTKKAGQVAV